MLRIIMQYSLVKLVFDGIAAQKIDDQLAKQSFPVLKVMNTIMNTEIMNTFQKTFVQDCSYFYHHYFPCSHVSFFIFL